MNVFRTFALFCIALLVSQARASSEALSEEEEDTEENNSIRERERLKAEADAEQRREYPEMYGDAEQGDMIIPKEELEELKRLAKSGGHGKYRTSIFNSAYFSYGGTYGYGWIYYGLGRIPYYVTPDFKQRTAAEGNGSHTPYEIFMDAIAYIKNEVACVDFFPFEGATTPYYVLVDYGASCQAEIGCRMKSGQKLDLGPYCTFKRGTVLHEIMHVLGFYHEHTRQDRDSEVTVHLENVETSPNDRRSNFDVVSTDFVDHSPVYDCGSVMHYTHNAYSTDKISLDTITGKTTACRNVMGQRVDFSPIDKATLAAKYGPPCPA